MSSFNEYPESPDDSFLYTAFEEAEELNNTGILPEGNVREIGLFYENISQL